MSFIIKDIKVFIARRNKTIHTLFLNKNVVFPAQYGKLNVVIFNIAIFIQFNSYPFNLIFIYSFNLIIVHPIQFL